MAWTHFKFTELGERTVTKVNGSPAAVNVWYPAADVITNEKVNPAHYGEPFDTIKYKATNGTEESNVAQITIDCPPNMTVPATSTNQTVTAAEDTLYNLITYIPFSAGVDRIEIVNFDDIGSLEFEGSNIFPGFVMMHYDFALMTFKTAFGTGVPVQSIKYRVGNASGMNPTVYQVDFNVAGIAYVDNTPEVVVSDGITNFKGGDITVKRGRVNGTAKVNLNINLSAGAFATTGNTVTITQNGSTITRTANTNEDIIMNLNSLGEVFIAIGSRFADADTVTGTVTITLLEINGSTALVDGADDTVVFTYSF